MKSCTSGKGGNRHYKGLAEGQEDRKGKKITKTTNHQKTPTNILGAIINASACIWYCKSSKE